MSDIAIMGGMVGGVLGSAMLIIFLVTERQSNKRDMELKMFQTENTRLIQEWRNESRKSHEEHMTYFHGMMQFMARVIRKQEEGEGGAK